MYTGNSLILSQGAFTAEQIDRAFSALGYAPKGLGQSIIDECARYSPVINHDITAGMIAHESGWWTSRISREKNNPSGLGAVNSDPWGGAIRFETPRQGIEATVAHLASYAIGKGWWDHLDPRHSAMPESYFGCVVVANDLNGKWAWPGPTYGDGITARANVISQYSGGDRTVRPEDIKIFLSAGHWNTAGGNHLEQEVVEKITIHVYNLLFERKYDVRLAQEIKHGGLVVYPGTHNDVARAAMEAYNSGWKWNLFLEIHTEGVGNTSVRGPFGIFPHNDQRQDLDHDVRERLAPDTARRISERTGIPLRELHAPGGIGVMSEKQTHVRELGVFVNTVGARDTSERMIFECASHTNPTDLSILRERPYEFAEEIVNAIANFYGVENTVDPPPPSDYRVFEIPGKGLITVSQPFLNRWDTTGDWARWGYPETEQMSGVSEDGVNIQLQYFERGIMELRPDGTMTDARVGTELFELRESLKDVYYLIDIIEDIDHSVSEIKEGLEKLMG